VVDFIVNTIRKSSDVRSVAALGCGRVSHTSKWVRVWKHTARARAIHLKPPLELRYRTRTVKYSTVPVALQYNILKPELC
jgi:hypothetical protein